MSSPSFAPWPSFTEEEIEAVNAVLRSNRVNYWTGDRCRQFEERFAAWTGTRHAIAVANGTVALDLALHGLGIGAANRGSAKDEVIVTPRTFIASVSCVINAGARPVFADVDRRSGNMNAETIAAVLTERTRAIIVVHLAGWPADMDPIMTLAEAHGIKVIEDCAQAHGARYKGRSVGSIGHVGAWSFCQDKIMTTGGEGGMVTTSDRDLWSRMWSFKDHGKSWEAVYERAHPPGFRWVHDSFGTNWRMIEMQAAIGLVQLNRIAEWTAARAANSTALHRALEPFAGENSLVRLPRFHCAPCPECTPANGCIHAYYKFHFHLNPGRLRPGWSRQRVVDEISSRGVPCFVGSCSEVYRERAFEGSGFRPAEPLPVARELGETSVMMLAHPTLTADQMALSARIAAEVVSEASL